MAVFEHELVQNERDLESLARALSSSARIALDAEGDGMFRYRARLCTLQLCAEQRVFIVDTLLSPAAPALTALLGKEGPEKIVHDVSFDARVLHAHGISLENVFDTAIAARFLGIVATGLSSLLEARFGVRLDKNHQQADWGRRPLADEMLHYLVEDVRHLENLADSLLKDVRAKGIEGEVREEVRYVLAQARESEPHEVAWMRVKGAATLMPAQRAALRAFADERELLAQELDMPSGRLVSGDAMLRIVARESVTAGELERMMSPPARPHTARLFAALERGRRDEDAPEDEVRLLTPAPLSPAQIDARKKRRKLLTDLRAQEAKARGVDPQVVLPGHCLADLLALDEIALETLSRVPGFGEVRLARYGETWVREFARKWPR